MKMHEIHAHHHGVMSKLHLKQAKLHEQMAEQHDKMETAMMEHGGEEEEGEPEEPTEKAPRSVHIGYKE